MLAAMDGFDTSKKERYDFAMNYENWDQPAGEDTEDWEESFAEEEVFEAPQREDIEYPKSLGRFGRLGPRSSDPRVHYKGEHVETLLSRMGWNETTFTDELANEVKQIQAEHGLLETGLVDRKTWNIIVNGD